MLENLRIGRIAVHEVHRRDDQRRIVQPGYATSLENLDVAARDAFRNRVVDALSARSKCLEMDIVRSGENTFVGDANEAIACDDNQFLQYSRRFADRLAETQTSQQIPGGMLIVFTGTTGQLSNPFVAVIKAEIQDGFRRRRDGEAVITEFINDLFLTKATRLYKIGLMVRSQNNGPDPHVWRALVFDHQIQQSHREGAALYFYESYLGCRLPEDSAYETARFFNLTREFVNKSVTDRDQRHDIVDALYTFVKTDQDPTFTAEEFNERYVPQDLRERYENFMTVSKFPARAVVRDTQQLSRRLKRRRFKYGSDIEFSISPEALAEDRAEISIIPAPEEPDGVWTRIIVKVPFSGET